MDAETVTIELLAKVDGFDGKVRQSAANFGGAMTEMQQKAQKAEDALQKFASAQTRHAEVVGRYKALLDGGRISQTRFNVEVLRSKSNVDSAGASYRKAAGDLDKLNAGSAAAQNVSKRLGLQIGQIGSQLAVGTSPFIIMAQQSSDLAIALDGTGGKLGKVIGFFGTWQGALLLAAGTIAAQVLPKLFEMNDGLDDEVEKLKDAAEKSDLHKRAQEQFGNTIKGVTQALEDNRKALDALNLVQDTSAEKALKLAEAERKKAISIRETTVTLLEQAKAAQELAISNAGGGVEGAEVQGFVIRATQKRIDDLEAQRKKAEQNLEIARQQVVEARANVVVEQAMASAEDKINTKYDQRIDAAKKLAIANGTVETSLRKQIDAINALREADLKRLRDTQRESSKSSLPAVTGSEIAKALGTTITSGTRSAAHNKEVGGAANSYHLTGQAIDIPLTVNGKPLTKAGIRAVLEPLGVQIKELLGPGDKGHSDHFHIAFSKTRAGPDKIAEQQQRSAEQQEREAQAEERRRQTFENERAGLQSDELDAYRSLVTNVQALDAIQLHAIDVTKKAYDDNLDSLVKQGKLTQDEANELRALNDATAELRKERVKRAAQERDFRVHEADLQRQASFESEQRGLAEDILQNQEDLARTQKERRDIEHKLLDLQFAEEKARNDYIIAYAERLRLLKKGIEDEEQRNADEAAREAKARNDTLDQRKSLATQKSDQKTQSPLQSYFDSIPNTADEINEALENVAAGGLQTFVDSLTDAIVNFRSLGDVGLAVLRSLTAGLVKMAIQQVLLHTIGKALGATSIATTTAEAAAAGAAWAGPAALASLATLGANAGPAAAALASTTALATALGVVPKKDGGPIFGPGGPRDDKVLMAASPGEYVIKARSATKLGRGTLDYLNMHGEVPTAFAGGGFVAVRPNNAQVRATGGGVSVLSPDALRQLEGVVERAVTALPDVKLYPTLDPAMALRAALASPGGQRALFDFVGQNSGKFRSRLNA